jgi:hypothetical protein
MHVTRLIAAIAAFSLTSVSALATPIVNPAAGLSLAGDASGTAKSGGTKTKTVVIAGLALAAVVGGAIALGTSHHSTPASS